MNDPTLNDLRADGAICGLHFHAGAASRDTRAFVAELATVLITSATPKKPLLITNDHALTALFRFFEHADLRDPRGKSLAMTGGRRFADLEGYASHAHLGCGTDLPEGGRWTDGRSPANTFRHDLPVFDSARISREIEALLERWASAGKLIYIDQPATAPHRSWVELARGDSPAEPTRIDRFTDGQREAMKYLGIE